MPTKSNRLEESLWVVLILVRRNNNRKSCPICTKVFPKVSEQNKTSPLHETARLVGKTVRRGYPFRIICRPSVCLLFPEDGL